jgi:hypothetical protein
MGRRRHDFERYSAPQVWYAGRLISRLDQPPKAVFAGLFKLIN